MQVRTPRMGRWLALAALAAAISAVYVMTPGTWAQTSRSAGPTSLAPPIEDRFATAEAAAIHVATNLLAQFDDKRRTIELAADEISLLANTILKRCQRRDRTNETHAAAIYTADQLVRQSDQPRRTTQVMAQEIGDLAKRIMAQVSPIGTP